MGLFKGKAEKELDGIISRLEINMSNNYKDAAISDFNDLEAKYNELKSLGSLREKAASKYASILDGYKEKLKGYSHKDQKPYWHYDKPCADVIILKTL